MNLRRIFTRRDLYFLAAIAAATLLFSVVFSTVIDPPAPPSGGSRSVIHFPVITQPLGRPWPTPTLAPTR